jgi:two-component system response regulator
MSLILLVEDDPSDEKLALRAFKRCEQPFEVAVVRDGAEALEFLFAEGKHQARAGAPPPRLVLLDLKLPRIDGIDVLRRVRADERTRLVPVVVFSASREDEDMRRSLELGANAYLRKPVDFAEFVEAARVLVTFWLSLNQRPPLAKGSV